MNYCPKCGYEVKDMKFCPKCGFDVTGESAKPTEVVEINERDLSEPIQGIPVDDMDHTAGADYTAGADQAADATGAEDLRAALIGKKTEHYMPIFEELDRVAELGKGKGTHWNWCAFFFAPYWFAYRKMYGWSAFTMFAPAAAGFLIGIIISIVGDIPESAYELVGRAIGLCFGIFFGIYGNSMYKKRIDKLAAEAPRYPAQREEYIRKKGGVSVVAMILAIIIYVAFILLITIPEL